MNGLIRRVLKAVGVKWLTSQVRAAAEGKLGPRWKALYWGLAGKKRWISAAFGIFSGALSLAGYQHVAEACAGIAVVGVALGFVDANWRTEQWGADWLKDSAVWRVLAYNAPVLTAGILAALGWLQGSTCTLGVDWCGYGSIAVTVLGCALVQVGIVDAAWMAPPPNVRYPTSR